MDDSTEQAFREFLKTTPKGFAPVPGSAAELLIKSMQDLINRKISGDGVALTSIPHPHQKPKLNPRAIAAADALELARAKVRAHYEHLYQGQYQQLGIAQAQAQAQAIGQEYGRALANDSFQGPAQVETAPYIARVRLLPPIVSKEFEEIYGTPRLDLDAEYDRCFKVEEPLIPLPPLPPKVKPVQEWNGPRVFEASAFPAQALTLAPTRPY